MTTINDQAWTTYIKAKGITFNQPAYVVEAAELKDITKREPRLLAKFDTPEQLPTPFKTAGYTLVPTRNGQWYIVRGSLFVEPPPCAHSYLYEPKLPFPLVTLGRGSGESQYIDAAFNTGLLTQFLGISEMYLTIRGREYTRPFEYKLEGYTLRTQSVQIEVDAGYEALHDIVLLEAKIDKPRPFNIRQLYYPYRHFSALVPRKRIRNVFLTYDLPSKTYHLYEYTFRDPLDPLSARTEKCAAYRIAPPENLAIHDLIDARFQSRNRLVPQADDLNKVFELLSIVDAGLNRADDVADYFVFAKRQSSYYREAAEYLGLLTIGANNTYQITELGMYLLSQPMNTQARALATAVVNSWIFVELLRRAGSVGRFTVADIDETIAAVKDNGIPRYNTTTVERRRQTIIAWLRWLAQEIGCVAIMPDGYRFK